MASRPKGESPPNRKPPAAKTLEAREHQLTSLAVDLAEKQLRDGTASSQVMTHFLKLATVREQLEMKELKLKNDLLVARTEGIASAGRIEEMYSQALSAFSTYSGSAPEPGDD